MKTVAAFIFICGTVTSAANAGEVRIDQAGGSMEKMPILSQLQRDSKIGPGPLDGYDLGDCYSYAAVQYWDTYRYLHSTAAEKAVFKPSSSDYAAILSSSVARNKGKGDFNGGKIEEVVKFLGKQSTCSEQYIASQPIYQKAVLLYFSGRAALVNEMPIESARSPITSSPGLEFMENHRLQMLEKIQYGNSRILSEFAKAKLDLSQELTRLGRPLSDAVIDQFLMTSGSVDDFVINALHVSCPKQNEIAAQVVPFENHDLLESIQSYLRIATYLGVKDEKTVKEGMGKAFDRFLNQFPVDLAKHFAAGGTQSLPVPVSYCGQFLLQGKNYPGLQVLFSGEHCGGHASVITGIRTNDKNEVTEVLIRNSYGEDACSVFSLDFECSNGSTWVTIDTLTANLLDYGT